MPANEIMLSTVVIGLALTEIAIACGLCIPRENNKIATIGVSPPPPQPIDELKPLLQEYQNILYTQPKRQILPSRLPA